MYAVEQTDPRPPRDSTSRGEAATVPRALLERLAALGDSAFKILAKRARADGQVSFMLTLITPERRFLLGQGDGMEELFREFVAQAEDALLSTGWVGEPVIIARDEWRQYEPPTGR